MGTRDKHHHNFINSGHLCVFEINFFVGGFSINTRLHKKKSANIRCCLEIKHDPSKKIATKEPC